MMVHIISINLEHKKGKSIPLIFLNMIFNLNGNMVIILNMDILILELIEIKIKSIKYSKPLFF